jgi:Uma2 family endonuclease
LRQLPMTAADYLDWDASQTVKHEFLAGEIFAMVGAAKTHGAVTLNIAIALRQHLRGTSCSTFVTDIKLQVQAADAYFYPDVMVTCSARDSEDPLFVREPSLVIEVLSPSTAAFDIGAKFVAYRQLPSLLEMVFIDPESHRCDVYRKGTVQANGGLWVLHPFEPDQDVHLASVELDLPASLLWEGMPAAAAAAGPLKPS